MNQQRVIEASGAENGVRPTWRAGRVDVGLLRSDAGGDTVSRYGQDTPLPGGFSSETDTIVRLVQGLRSHRLPPEQVEDLRTEIRRLLGLIGPAPESHSACRAVETAHSWLIMQPRKAECPTHLFIGGLEAVVRELREHCPPVPVTGTAAAAAYTCLPERGDPRTVQSQLQGAAALLGGRLDHYHHDKGLRAWSLEDRPGWRRIERLVSARSIQILVLVTLDELIPTPGLRVPPGARREAHWELRQSCLRRGVRLACVDDLTRAVGAA
ncbi:hypothetical protein [Streptomyces sp. NPDC001828]|uniref:hypothetical protein n=1 Tax=Streptomyces sp. NPDC001828 TaxID=3364615 RepID=UPI00368842BB